MTKQELATRLAETANLQKSEALRAVEGMIEVMSEAFAHKDSIFLRGFGTYKIVTRKEKKARDIGRAKEVMIPEHLTVKFSPSDTLLHKMNRQWPKK